MKVSMKARLLGLLLVPVIAIGFAVAPALTASAEGETGENGEATSSFTGGISSGADSAQGTDQATCLFGNESGCTGEDGKKVTPIFQTITNVLLFIIGAVSVIMLIIGGIRYTVSAGDSSAVTAAKNTILYAIVGIVVAILAYAVVNFVISSFVTTTPADSSNGSSE